MSRVLLAGAFLAQLAIGVSGLTTFDEDHIVDVEYDCFVFKNDFLCNFVSTFKGILVFIYQSTLSQNTRCCYCITLEYLSMAYDIIEGH